MTSHKQLLPLLVLLGVLLAGAPSGFAQAPQPLNFGNNFLVTGDYVVAGAYNMTTKFTTINGVSYAVGTINVPDVNSKGVPNPGIQGPTSVPKGAQVIAALLYWQAVEKVGATGTATGQNGYFLPLVNASSFPKGFPGYPISGTNVTSPGNPSVSWSSGGCGGSSTGKVVKTYRADVGGGLPVDPANGNSIANTSFQVLLPSSGNSTPLTLGATLVVIYRVSAGEGGPSVPLNAIVIYDGDYGQTNAQLTMTQQMQGFYDADGGQVRLTHIVGSGQSNKFENVFLGKDQNNLTKLSPLYGKNLPPFPGWYGTWDNPTWTLNDALGPAAGTPLGSATTQVVPAPSMSGCVSWGAVIMSTTVKNTDNDGILDSWKDNQGYCDYLTNASCSGSQDMGWIPLLGAAHNQKDIFLQYDYMCSKVNGPPRNTGDNASDNSCTTGDGTNYSFDPRLAVDSLDNKNAAQKVVDAFKIRSGADNKLFVLHAEPGNAIAESQSTCAASDLTCTFPGEPGTVGFREGLAYIKNQTINTQTGILGCDPSADPTNCVAVFHHGKKDSYHYALFSHGVGLPNWFLSDGSIKTVTQSGSTVTFTTASAHNLAPIAGDTACPGPNNLGRVTVINAITNPNLNGTFCAKPANPPASNKFAITVTALPPSTVLSGYTVKTDPNLAIANGQVTSMSGYSDVGGQNSVISLGYGGWGSPQNLTPPSEGNKWNVKAGTFMHELGHTLGLTHGGTFYNGYSSSQADPTKNDFTPTFEVNCKPNVQTVMSYVFQFDLLQAPGPLNMPPVKVLDYSNVDTVATLTESSPQAGGLNNLTYPNTSWFQLSTGPVPSNHCDGFFFFYWECTYTYTNQPVADFSFSVATGEDINFNGHTDVMHPHDEWAGTAAEGGAGLSPGVDLRQVSAAGTVTTIGIGGEAGGFKPAGGGGGFKPAGGGGGLQPAGGGGGFKPAGGGGGFKPAGGGGASAEITHDQANSYPRPAQNLYIQQEEASPRLIDLSWFAPSFGTPVNYKIYRSAAGVNGGAFSLLATVPGSPTTYPDTVTCNTGGYHYRVTAVTANDAGTQQLESSPSNTVPAVGEPLLTGCYVVPAFAPAVASAVQAESVNIAWTLQDDFYVTPPNAWADAQQNVGVTNNNLAANTLYAVGPVSNNQCATVTQGRTLLVNKGVKQNANDALGSSGDVFTFTWNNTDNFCAGSYTFELDLDSGQKFTSSPLQLNIDINDSNSSPHVTTVALPVGTVGKPYSDTLTEDGGTAPFTWIVTGLPTGISQQPASSATISGTACMAGPNAVNATVMDSASPKNSGSQAFTLQVNTANTTTSVSSTVNPSVFQQPVTFTVTVAPQYSCTPTGTVTLYDGGQNHPIGSAQLANGTATFAFSGLSSLSVGNHSITASYGGDSNFNASNSNSTPWSQTVNKASTATSLSSVSPSPAFVGQPITVSFTFGVVAPGAGTPIAPSGSITVLASDHSTCTVPAVLGGGMCTLVPAPTTPGNRTFTITYAGDGNFVASGDNGNYDVNQLVFTAQPSNTGVGLTMTPAVVVTAEDSSNTTLTTFTGGITLAIGAASGTLSGTTSQNAVAGVATFSNLSINKIATGDTLTASPDGVHVSATSNAFNVDTFYVDGSGNFGTLDLPTGNVTKIGAATVPNSTGMDLTPGLQVYAYNTSNQLMQITPSTGAANLVGTGTIPDQAITGALTGGSYFGIDAVTGILYSINTSTGATTSVGPTSTTLVPAGCSFEASLTGSTTVLYYTIASQAGPGCSASPETLYQINPADGSAVAAGIAITGTSGNIVGSAYVGGTLYGFTSDSKEYSIIPATGAATFVTNTTVPIIGAGGQ